MPRRLLAAVCLAACSAGGAPPAVPSAPPPAPAAAAKVRLFHSPTDADFWVERTASRDSVIAGGARLEVEPSGEITAVAWDLELSRSGDGLAGALAVPARLGGGFVHWSRTRVFRSATFTGPLTPVLATGNIRGARAGLSSVVVFTDAGPRVLAAGAPALRPLADPGVVDLAAVSPLRAARLDLFGRLAVTDDGGRTFVEPPLGLGATNLAVGEGELFVETGEARIPIRAGGKLDHAAATARSSLETGRAFRVAWSTPRAAERSDSWSNGASPLAAAVAAGGDVGDGTAFAVLQTSPVRVDLRTGQAIAVSAEQLPPGLSCQPLHAADATLFACTWDRYQGYGGVVLRSVAGAPPVVEKAFSDDGGFFADDEGALVFAGSCRAEPRWFDPDEQARLAESDAPPALPPVACVRRGPGEWIEKRTEIGDDATIVGWAPGRDGNVVALAMTTDPLPPPSSPAGRAEVRAGVRVVLLDRDLGGWNLAWTGWQSGRATATGSLDRRFHLRDDGTVDAWLTPVPDGVPPLTVGAAIDARGIVTVHSAAPAMIAAVAAGARGVALSRDGSLYESDDHGRTWRLAGPSPVPASAFSQAGCSALGCALGPVIRLGWGEAAVAPRVLADELRAADPPPPARRLSCTTLGVPVPQAVVARPDGEAHTEVGTAWGDVLDIVHDAAAVEEKAAPAAPPPPPPKTRRAPVAVLRTHTLVVPPPFAPRAPARRINATNAAFSGNRRARVTPLLGEDGEVQLLVAGASGDLLVAGDRVTVLPAADGRRFSRSDGAPAGGLALAAGRALVLDEVRRRLVLHERGSVAPAVPVALGVETEEHRGRLLTLGRRADGAAGVLVLDGPAPETVGSAIIDRVAALAGPVTALAPWSTAVAADDPRCAAPDKAAFRALVLVDPTQWLALDPAALPGTRLGHQGLFAVRWGKDRVCVEALTASLVDERNRGVAQRAFRLVARWAGGGERGAALRAPDLRQDLTCRID